MNDTDAFLRKIRENPDDDAPRLVFADYLDELAENPKNKQAKQQQRWAKLIRAQINLRYQTEADASFWRNLCEGDSAYGCKPASEVMPKSMRGKSWLAMNRGFYDHISLTAPQFRGVSDDLMNSDAPIRKLTLKSAGSNWADVADIPAFQLLRELEFTVGSTVSDIRSFFTRPLKHLTGLALPSAGKVVSEGLPLLTRLKDGPVLKRFQGLNLVDGDPLTELLNSPVLAQLEEFYHSGGSSPDFYHKLSHAPMSKTLTSIQLKDYVNLIDNNVNRYDHLEWGKFENLRDLEILIYRHYSLKWAGKFLNAQNLQNLRRVLLEGAGLPSDILDYFLDTNAVIELNLKNYPLNKLAILLGSAGMERVTSLILPCDFPEVGYQMLEDNPYACNISKLMIAGRGYRSDPVVNCEKITSCSKLKNLVYLGVDFDTTLLDVQQLADSSLGESLLAAKLMIGYNNGDKAKVAKIFENHPNLIFLGYYYHQRSDSLKITNWLNSQN